MTLKMVLSTADLIAALQTWVASPTGGSVGGVTHQMDAAVNPAFDTTQGTVTVLLNF